MTVPPVKAEFSRFVGVEQLGLAPISQAMSATSDECKLLARRFGLVALNRFEASVRLQRLADSDIIRVEGRFEADVIQTCVVTLEAFPSHVEDSFSVDFSTDSSETSQGLVREITIDIDEEPVEPIIGGVLDVGELASQYLALGLDPYPRAPGVALNMVWEGPDPSSVSPFAMLKNLKPDG